MNTQKTERVPAILKHEATWAIGASIMSVLTLLALGLRATTPYSAAHAQAIARVAQALKLGAPLTTTLEGAHPGITWIIGLLSHLSGLSPALTARGVELLMAAAVTALTWTLMRRLTDRLGAAIALILLWGCPVWLGMASVAQTTMTMSALLLSLVALMSLPAPKLRHDLMLALVAAMLWLSWPVAALLGALLALLRLKATPRSADEPPISGGLLGRPSLPLGTLMALLCSLPLATLIHPGLWRDPINGWLSLLEHTLLKPELSGGLYRGQTIGALRLPWYAGPDLLLWQSSLPLLILGLMGAVAIFFAKKTAPATLTQPALALTLGVLILSPWWSADAMTGMASLVAMTTPLLAILGAPLARQALTQGWGRLGTSRAASVTITALMLLVCMAGPMMTARAWPFLGATWAPWRGGLGGALEAEMPAQYDEALPISVVQEAQRQGCALSLALMASAPSMSTPPQPKCVIERQIGPAKGDGAALGLKQAQLFTRSDY